MSNIDELVSYFTATFYETISTSIESITKYFSPDAHFSVAFNDTITQSETLEDIVEIYTKYGYNSSIINIENVSHFKINKNELIVCYTGHLVSQANVSEQRFFSHTLHLNIHEGIYIKNCINQLIDCEPIEYEIEEDVKSDDNIVVPIDSQFCKPEITEIKSSVSSRSRTSRKAKSESLLKESPLCTEVNSSQKQSNPFKIYLSPFSIDANHDDIQKFIGDNFGSTECVDSFYQKDDTVVFKVPVKSDYEAIKSKKSFTYNTIEITHSKKNTKPRIRSKNRSKQSANILISDQL